MSRDVGGGEVEAEVDGAAPVGQHRPEGHAGDDLALVDLAGRGDVLERARPLAGHQQVGRPAGQQLDPREREVAPPELVLRAVVGAHALARDEEEALPQHGDPAAGRARRLELPLGHLDQRAGVPAGAQVAGVDHPHVGVAPQARPVAPLLEVDALGPHRPVALGVEEGAERGEVEPVHPARPRLVAPPARTLLAVPRHQPHQHLAVQRVEAHPERVGDRRQQVDEVLDRVVRRPQGARLARRLGAVVLAARGHPRVPQLGAAVPLHGPVAVEEAGALDGREQQAVGELERRHRARRHVRHQQQRQQGEQLVDAGGDGMLRRPGDQPLGGGQRQGGEPGLPPHALAQRPVLRRQAVHLPEQMLLEQRGRALAPLARQRHQGPLRHPVRGRQDRRADVLLAARLQPGDELRPGRRPARRQRGVGELRGKGEAAEARWGRVGPGGDVEPQRPGAHRLEHTRQREVEALVVGRHREGQPARPRHPHPRRGQRWHRFRGGGRGVLLRQPLVLPPILLVAAHAVGADLVVDPRNHLEEGLLAERLRRQLDDQRGAPALVLPHQPCAEVLRPLPGGLLHPQVVEQQIEDQQIVRPPHRHPELPRLRRPQLAQDPAEIKGSRGEEASPLVLGHEGPQECAVTPLGAAPPPLPTGPVAPRGIGITGMAMTVSCDPGAPETEGAVPRAHERPEARCWSGWRITRQPTTRHRGAAGGAARRRRAIRRGAPSTVAAPMLCWSRSASQGG